MECKPRRAAIDSDINNAAVIKYPLKIIPNPVSNTSIISFFLDSYVSNAVYFRVWIFGNKPGTLSPNTFKPDQMLYSHSDPSVSSLRLSANDPKRIKCTNIQHSETVECNGIPQTITNNTAHIYIIIYIDTASNKSAQTLNELQITVNNEPFNANKTVSLCTEDCGPNGQLPQEQLPLYQGSTMWNALIVKYDTKNTSFFPKFLHT